MITRDKWIGKHFGAGKRLIGALVQAERYIQLNPSKVQAFIKKRFNYSDEYISYIYPKHHFRIDLSQSLILTMEDQAQWRIDNRLTKKTKVPNFLFYIHADMLSEIKPENVSLIR